MLTSILSFFKPTEANISKDFVEVPSETLSSADYIIVEFNDERLPLQIESTAKQEIIAKPSIEQEQVVSKPETSEDYIIVEFNDERLPLQIESTARQEIIAKPSIEQEQVVSKPETSRHELWKMRNPKIFKKFTDASGQVHEVRYVNYDKQLAFWDPKTQKQKNVYRSQFEDQTDIRGCGR